MIPNTNFYNNISEFRRDKSTILFTLAESDYLGFRHLCLLEQPAIGLILFAGQQAIEKYLKAIILLNDRPVNNLGHNLSDILTEALNSSQSLTSKNNRAFCETIITHFNNAENSRYASAHIIVDDMLHHKLDALVVETLRKSYIEDYMLIFGKDIDYKYLDLINSMDCFQAADFLEPPETCSDDAPSLVMFPLRNAPDVPPEPAGTRSRTPRIRGNRNVQDRSSPARILRSHPGRRCRSLCRQSDGRRW